MLVDSFVGDKLVHYSEVSMASKTEWNSSMHTACFMHVSKMICCDYLCIISVALLELSCCLVVQLQSSNMGACIAVQPRQPFSVAFATNVDWL